MLRTFYGGVFALLLLVSCTQKETIISREESFDKDWKFIRSDVQGGQNVALDDSGWKTLDLPHDYSIEDLPEKQGVKQIGPFSEESAGKASTGHVVGGTAWYRKHFTLAPEDEGKTIKILFDGVYMNADFWINGNHLGNHPYGYTAFAYDLTEYLNASGDDNVLAVQVKNEGKNSRWYSGSGIYRNVSLLKLNPVHIDLWGVYVTTPEVSEEKATVKIETKIKAAESVERLTLKGQLLNPDGQIVAKWNSPVDLNQATAVLQTELEFPSLWSPDSPALYTAKMQLFDGNMVIDEYDERFGIRSIDFSPGKGFLLNGKSVLLKGGCLHHDNGPLGSAAFKAAEYRRVKTMKENGFNAIRTSHNPPSKHFLDACDELGVLVMDESFDHWQRGKNDQDYHLYFDDWWERDLESMILRDRNHPSIVVWSVGNEINERADSSGLEIFKFLREKVLTMDNTRPVTQAICHFWDHPGWDWDRTIPAFAQMDIHSYNYQWKNYEPDHEKHPERIIVGTESFPKEAFDNWDLVEKHPNIIGDFVWTGMDYLGESGIGHNNLDNENVGFLPDWPWYNAYCGDISILGYKKPQMYYRDVVWRNSELEMLVHEPVPDGRTEVVSMWGWPEEWKSWNWEGNEGIPLQVAVYTRCDQVRLELNGEVIGTKDVAQKNSGAQQMDIPSESRQIEALAAYFDVPYQAGELVAIGIKDGKEVVRQSLKTAGKPAVLKVVAENESGKASGNDLAYFNIEVVDANGNLVPNAELPVEFTIEGNGSLQAVANGNPSDMKSFQQPRVNTFRGKCQLIVRSGEDGTEIKVTAASEGLESGHSTVKVQ
ncbi:glycoside hydrolase family 2 TIM barrel-domain containing protein [Draconibacterium mangrovi]|uniref:glycoside hydrolase family 2 TIM barrel-domain containing protein n=1 Tax=Draconibacterium mangrovi TaxID=2697469 RepID=UPI0013D50347|nr:glycoside hydrolase family 2 TIM barrel-domain containing protein [Draconibacterium mangrovi]